MKLIQNLSMSRKFALIAVLAVAMLAVPTGIVVKTDLESLRAARHQQQGSHPSHQLIKLVALTQQHRALSAVLLGGDGAVASERQSKQQAVDAALTATRQALLALADAKLTAAGDAITAEFGALAGAVSGKALVGPASSARHSALIARQLELLQDVSQVSEIVLVPDPALYYLQDGVLAHLPKMTEAMGQVRARGASVLASGKAEAEERALIKGLLDEARAHHASAVKSLASAAGYDDGLRQAVAGAQQQGAAAAERLFAVVDEQILRATSPTMSAKQFVDVSTQAIDVQFRFVDAAFKHLDMTLNTAVASARNEIAYVTGGLALLAALAGWLMWTISRTTTRAMAEAVRVAESVADGDLSASVPQAGRDEVGQLLLALGNMKQSLVRVVGQVRGNADSVATASAQISQGNADLSQRTEEQASALEQTAASMEQLGSTVKQNAENARQANQLAHGASEVAGKGGQVVAQVVSTMKGIQTSSQRIAEIIGTIDGIAFQTNILALNAAVEAARAGEQGRGFAVVAGEVRTLAQRSAEAAREIKRLITDSVEQVDAGTALVDRAGETMQEVVTSIRRVTDIMGEISSASVEQSQGVSQVGEAVSQMDQVTQQNAALVEQSAAAAESLKHQAQQLVQTVSVFKLGSGASTAVAPPAAAAAAVAAVALPAWDGQDRRSPERARNVSRPAFGSRKAVPTAQAAAIPAAKTTVVAKGPSASAESRTGTDDKWATF